MVGMACSSVRGEMSAVEVWAAAAAGNRAAARRAKSPDFIVFPRQRRWRADRADDANARHSLRAIASSG